MTTFWLIFADPDKPRGQRFLGVAIFDMDESGGEVPFHEVIQRSWALGINPGGEVMCCEATQRIPGKYRNMLITDEAVLMKLGSRGRAKENMH